MRSVIYVSTILALLQGQAQTKQENMNSVSPKACVARLREATNATREANRELEKALKSSQKAAKHNSAGSDHIQQIRLVEAKTNDQVTPNLFREKKIQLCSSVAKLNNNKRGLRTIQKAQARYNSETDRFYQLLLKTGPVKVVNEPPK